MFFFINVGTSVLLINKKKGSCPSSQQKITGDLLSLCWLPPQDIWVEQETIWEQAWVPGPTEQVMLGTDTQHRKPADLHFVLPADGDLDVDLHYLW